MLVLTLNSFSQISDGYVCSSECYIHSNMGTPFTVIGSIKKDEYVNGLTMQSSLTSNTLITVLGIDSAINKNGSYDIYYQISISKNNKIITIPANETIDEQVQRVLNEQEIRTNFNYKEAISNGLNGWVLKEKLMTREEFIKKLNNEVKTAKVKEETMKQVAAMAKAGKSDEAMEKVLKRGGFTDMEILVILHD